LAFAPFHTPQEIKRILIVRTDRLGDVVLTLPILPVLRNCFPNAFIAMLLKRYTGEIVEGNPYVDELIWYDNENTPMPFWGMCGLLRERSFDATVVVYPRPRLALLMACAGIPLRIGTGYRYYSFLFNRRVYEHRSDSKKHEVEYNLNLLRELGCSSSGVPEFFIDIPESAERRVDGLVSNGNRRLVVLHPGSGGSAREWPAEQFGSLAAKLLHDGFFVVITGTTTERTKAEAIVRATDGKAISLVDALTVKELSALLKRSSLIVGNSTGPLHIAAAVGTPVLGLYPQHTAMSVRRWGPCTERKVLFVPEKPVECSDCLRPGANSCLCMASITVEQVYDAATHLLQNTRRLDTKVTA
jgi:heptosyltransferase-2